MGLAKNTPPPKKDKKQKFGRVAPTADPQTKDASSLTKYALPKEIPKTKEVQYLAENIPPPTKDKKQKFGRVAPTADPQIKDASSLTNMPCPKKFQKLKKYN